jgi:hypothetical protein
MKDTRYRQTAPQDLLCHAIALARAHYLVVPLIGKAPVHKGGHGWADGSRHIPEVQWLFSRRRHTGIGIATGEGSGAWVLDVDGHDGRVSLKALINEYGALPGGPVTVTHRGLHVWFAYTPECAQLRNRVGFMDGLDVRTNGGGVVVPPSAHPDGGWYCWRDVSLLDMEPPTAPDWLIREIIGTYHAKPKPDHSIPSTVAHSDKYVETALKSAEQTIVACLHAQRSTLWYAAVCIGKSLIAAKRCGEETALRRLTAAGMRMTNTKPRPWTWDEVSAVVADGLAAGVRRVGHAA